MRQVDAGHGDIDLLDAAAPRLVAAAGSVRATVRSNSPCGPELVRADSEVLAATRTLSRAGRELSQLTAAAKAGKDYSTFQSSFLNDIYPGADAFQAALVAIRGAGVPSLIGATDGKGIFLAAGCSACHTLAAAGAKGTLGPSLDAVKPSKTTVAGTVTNGQGEMFAFNGLLTADQIHAVAEFVNQSAAK